MESIADRTKERPVALLEMREIDKSFPGVQALKGVDLDLYSGEVLALLGENGAGKSTLIKILGGAHAPTAGNVLVRGREVDLSTPHASQAAGIGIIYQEFNLVPHLSARENIFLGQESGRGGFIDTGEERRKAFDLFRRLGTPIDPEQRCSDMTVAQQQVVEIAKALSQDARILVMDEPSATLTPQEVERLLKIVRELRTQGLGIIYISHRLEEVYEISDRIMVLRDGGHVATRPTGELGREALIELMVGRKLENEFPSHEPRIGDERLEVRELSRGTAVRDISFSARAGEILALTGLVGAGRTETVRLLFGADQPDSGSISLDGEALHFSNPRQAIRAGIGLLTEDRKGQGLVLMHSVREHFGLPSLEEFSRWGMVDRHNEQTSFTSFLDYLRIKVPHQDELARNLSGGYQQKVVLAKWLQRNCEVISFDEPTRGIDVGSKYEIYLLIQELAAQGKVIIMISSELPEVLGLADRVLVMHEGRITGEITDVRNATQEDIMRMAVA
ncbi:MAG: sugar ABC transporter ATP-binding protein [Roseibacillus sp.]|nr:sugar ABC transporter ATP-binding protein [Roseibacillus sp.]